MRKVAFAIFFIFILLTATIHSLLAQTSLRIEGGYMFPLAGGELNTYNNSITGAPAVTTGFYGSWGKGGSFGAVVDHKFNKYIDLEIGARFRYGASLSYADSISGLTNSTSNHLQTFVFSLGDVYTFCCTKNSVIPYIGAGILFAVDDLVICEETSNDDFGNSTIFNSTLTCAPTIGAYGELGLNFHLSPTFSFFTEVRADVLSLTPQKLYVNSVLQNGTDITNTLMPYQQETDYSKTPSSQPFSQLQPMRELAQPIPASSWGISIGVLFNFGTTPAQAK